MKTKEERIAYMKEYRQKNSEAIKTYQKRWYTKNADRINRARKEKYHADPVFREYELKRHRKYKEEKE